jgi:hypothetical protein
LLSFQSNGSCWFRLTNEQIRMKAIDISDWYEHKIYLTFPLMLQHCNTCWSSITNILPCTICLISTLWDLVYFLQLNHNIHKINMSHWLTQNWIWFSRSKSEFFVWKFYLKLDSSFIYAWNQNCSNLFLELVCVWDTIVDGFYDDTLEWELCCELHFETKSLKCVKLF